MTQPVLPPEGFYLRTPGLPAGRAVRALFVDAAENGPERFSQVIAERGSAERVSFDREVWNSQVVELAAMATTIASPRTNSRDGEISYALRCEADRVELLAKPAAQRVAVARELPGQTVGRPVIGAPLLVMRLPGIVAIEGFDPSAEGISAEESDRRTWVLATYETLAQMGRRATLNAPAERGAGVAWVVVGGVVLVGVAISAIVYGTQRAEIEARQAVEIEVLRNGLRAAEARILSRERTGVMPPVTPAETDAREVMTRRANEGWTRMRDALSDAVRVGSQGVGRLGIGLGLAAVVVLAAKSR